MKLFHYGKDGGDKSHVWGFWIIEIKWLFSIVLLRFEDGSRDAFHSHAFNCISWLLSGRLVERLRDGHIACIYFPSWLPFVTRRSRFHKVSSRGRSWVLSIRGPLGPVLEGVRPEHGCHPDARGRPKDGGVVKRWQNVLFTALLLALGVLFLGVGIVEILSGEVQAHTPSEDSKHCRLVGEVGPFRTNLYDCRYFTGGIIPTERVCTVVVRGGSSSGPVALSCD